MTLVSAWRKSSRSSQGGTDCVEIADVAGGGRAVRDSKNADGPWLQFTEREWDAFIADVRDGKLC